MSGASDAETLYRDGSLYTWVAGRNDAGIQLIRHDLGTLQDALQGYGHIRGAVRHEDVGGLQRVTELETITVGQNSFLLSLAETPGNTANASVLNAFAIGADLNTASGGLTLAASLATSGGSLMEADDFLAVKVGARAFVVTWSLSADGQTGHGAIGVHQLRANGSLIETTTLTETGNPALPLNGIVDAEATVFQGRTLVLTGANGFNPLNGANAGEGLGLWVLDS